jgi:endonuclease/exonuclease/phosphatase family metal-dependent hydrolase
MRSRILIATVPLAVFLVAIIAFLFWAGTSTEHPAQWSSVIRYSGVDAHSKPSGIVRVMTYNIGYCSGMANNLPVRKNQYFFSRNMKTFLEYLQKNPMDILAFQEIDFNSHRSYFVDQLDTVSRTLEFPNATRVVNWDKRYVPFPYWPPSVHFGSMLSGQGIVSRYEVLSNRREQLKEPEGMFFLKKRFYLHRLAQVVELELGERSLVVVNVHLEAFHLETRRSQARQVLELCREYGEETPMLVLGDFNCVPPDAPKKSGFKDEPDIDYTDDDTILLFLQQHGLKPALVGIPTFPSDKPDRQLDYIFYTPRWIVPNSAYTVPLDSSDHLPLVMEFTLR